MMRIHIAAVLLLVVVSGCASHTVDFTPATKNQISPREQAVVRYGTLEGVAADLDTSADPNRTLRDVCATMRKISRYVSVQIGSDAYMKVGDMVGYGKSGATVESLAEKFCERAAAEGGDLVFIYHRGVSKKAYSYTLAGMSYTSLYHTAPGEGFAITTHTPPKTYRGTRLLPYAYAMVYRRAPAMNRTLGKMAMLNDADLEKAFVRMVELLQDESLPVEQMLAQWEAEVDLLTP